MTWVAETLYADWAQSFRVIEQIAVEKSQFQEIRILDTLIYGRVMLLDGVVQVTEADEFIYQEMMAHVPLVQHGSARTVLIIGAGDGGVLRRVLLHDSVEHVTMVEIDEAVVRLAKVHMPDIGGAAWDDHRTELVIGDGIAYIGGASAASVDVIIVDSTDPEGPGGVLFTAAFYRDCARVLAPGGILVNQCGVPFMQPDELRDSTALRREAFRHVSTFLAAVPTYVGGVMAFGIASDSAMPPLSLDELQRRAGQSRLKQHCRYWSPAIHLASFALPPFVEQLTSGSK